MLSYLPAHTPVPSIALISSMAVAQIIASAALAEQRDTESGFSPAEPKIALPELGNTIELDRSLSREISDTFVFGENNQNRTDSAKTLAAVPDKEPNFANDSTNLLHSRDSTQSPDASTSVDGQLDSGGGTGSAQTITNPNVLNPEDSIDTNRNATVWETIIRSDRLPLTSHERVKFYLDQYQRKAPWISKILYRGTPFLSHIVATLDQRFLPIELALLPAIESGYKPTAKSRGNAVGLWQIVPITAKEIGVTRNTWFDGRGDVLTSTTAAIDYLSYLNAEFDGDWELTLAAYNAGPGRIRAAIEKNKARGLPTDYWSLDLPQETINYVPKLTALISMIKMPDHGGLDLPDLAMEPAFESIDIGFRVSLDRAAQIADIDIGMLRLLNAGLTHGVTAPHGPHNLLIPTGSGEKIQQAFSSIDRISAFSLPSTHNVASGDTISSIALKYGVTQRELLDMNDLDDTNIRIGQKLAVMNKSQLSTSVVKYVVSMGDTLSEIAHKFSVNVHDITLSTGETPSDDVIHPGDTLNITVNLPASG